MAEVIYCPINVILVALKNDLGVFKMFATVTHFCLSFTAVLFSCKVLQENQIPGDELLVKALTKVLTASQRYMREQTVKESLFVFFVDVGFHECTVQFYISLTKYACVLIVTVLLVNAHLCVQLCSLSLYLKQISYRLSYSNSSFFSFYITFFTCSTTLHSFHLPKWVLSRTQTWKMFVRLTQFCRMNVALSAFEMWNVQWEWWCGSTTIAMLLIL